MLAQLCRHSHSKPDRRAFLGSETRVATALDGIREGLVSEGTKELCRVLGIKVPVNERVSRAPATVIPL